MPTQTLATEPLVIIYGPTGVGKTDVSLALGEQLPLAVINMDVGQLYEPLRIGTAKPDWKHEPTPHYLFDVMNTPRDYTALDYRNAVSGLFANLHNEGRVPVTVGGSGFYAYSLLFEQQTGKVPSVKALYENQTTDELWHLLATVDPERAQAINRGDRYRLERALALWKATGKKPSELKPFYSPVKRPFLMIGVMRDREELYDRINRRTEIMLKEGWIEETKALIGTPWEDFLIKKGLIGYPEVFAYLHGKLSYQDLVRTIQQQTRNYAKRQCVYWRMLEKKVTQELVSTHDILSKVETINLTSMSFDSYIKQLSETIVLFKTQEKGMSSGKE